MIDVLAARLRAILGDRRVISDRQRLRTYECDGLAHYKVVPALVAFPHTAAEPACRTWPAALGPGCTGAPSHTPTGC
jgi:hypothetical protein